MAFCTNCGAKIEDDAKFCTECGAKVERLPSEPATEPVTTPTAPANDYTYTPPANDYTYTPPSNNYTYTPTAQNTAAGSYSPEIPRNTYSYDPAAASPGGTQPPRPPRDIPGGSQPPKKRSALLPIILIVVAVAALAALLIGFFANRSGDVYTAVYGKVGLRTVAAEDMWEDGFSIELFSNGKCRATVGDETETCRYELDDDGTIDVLLYDAEMHGTLSGDVIVFENVFDSGMDLYFVREGGSIPADASKPVGGQTTEAPAEAPVDTSSAYAWWDGDWYGWWVIYDGGGQWEELESYCYDACATISVYGDTGLVDLWDEDCEEGENIGYIDVSFEPGATDKGRMVSVSGNFYDDEIAARDWVVDPGTSVVSRFDSMIMIDGMYYEPGNSSNWVHYYVFLRPWGMSWEDVRSDSCYDMPYDDMMPFGYDNWYVPRMNGAMPSYIDIDYGEAA